MGIFDDERGRAAEELSFRAERAARAGDLAKAHDLYAQAARLETEVARIVPADAPRVRGVLAVSAVALWFKAGRYEDAETVGHEFLGDLHILSDARSELRDIVDRCRNESLKLVREAQYEELAQRMTRWMSEEHAGEPMFDPDEIEPMTMEEAA